MVLMFIYNKKFDEQYEYQGQDLGAVCGKDRTVFKLWAPLAESVELCLYNYDGDAEKETGLTKSQTASLREMAKSPLLMKKGERGVWQLELSGYLHGTYYDYRVRTKDAVVQSADPYARACGCNGRRSMVVDLRQTDPEGFLLEKAPERKAETIIYELHVKDFSYDPDSGIPDEFRGKYKAFTLPGKTGEAGSGATCMAYLKQLGVTHVHLLPVFDYGWLDEAGDDRQFNWGYDPVNFNVPEGSFATDAADGTVRIRECKEMIQALHRAGIRVVMDVVYNHMYEKDSWFERIVPGYYYRRWENGELSDGSACGNDMAAGRAMVDNYIVDSVLYWAREYHIDGFRFDLMGLLTTDLMNRIRRELDAEYGPGEKLLYGEPWRAADSPMEEGTRAALKANAAYLQDSVAFFLDDTRDIIKGDVFIAGEPGFVNGGRGLEKGLLHAVTGWRDNWAGFRPNSCSQIINYISAHDNYTLWDKLLITMEADADTLGEEDYLEPKPEILAANKLAALICFTCQGNLFFQAGEEFGRTKFGDDNSYRSAPEINMLRWKQAERFRELVEYYKGLISLRQKLPGLCDKSRDAWKRIQDQAVHRAGVVSFRVDNRIQTQQVRADADSVAGKEAPGCRQRIWEEGHEGPWDELLICYNASEESFFLELSGSSKASGASGKSDDSKAPDVSVDQGKAYPCERLASEWEILADDTCADCRKPVAGKTEVKGYGGMILGRRKNSSN